MTEIVRDVIVVGAGISGLSAAKLLKENGLDVIVLEAQNRVGGRTLTKRDSKLKYVDLGGSYIGPGQDRMLRLIKEFGLQTYKVNEVEDTVYMFKKGKVMRFSSDSPPSLGGFLEMLDLNNFFRLMDQMGEDIPADEPWNAPNARLLDGMTFKDFLDQNCWTKKVRQFGEMVPQMVTSECNEVSLLFILWYIKQCGGCGPIFSTTNGGQEMKIIGGTQQISEKIAEGLSEQRVLLEKPVVGITQTDNEVIVQTLDGSQYKSRFIIQALPPGLQQKIHYSPPLPPLRNQLIQRCPMGSVMKAIVYYETPFWRKRDFCGTILLIGVDDCPVTYTLDDTKPDGTLPAIVGFIPGDRCRRLLELTKEERLKRITESYAKAWNTDEALRSIHYEEFNWMDNQYCGGGYTDVCAPGFLTTFGKVLRKPIGKMYFASSETGTYWSGYMEGGVQAGERAAREILAEMGKIGTDQIWQNEPESKEVPHYYFKTTFLERNLPSVGSLLKISTLISAMGLTVAIPFIIKRYEINLNLFPNIKSFKL